MFNSTSMQAVVSVVEIRLHLHDEAAALAATEYLRCGHTCAGGPEPEPLCQHTVDAKLRRSCHRPFQLQTLPNGWHGWDPGEPERICFAKLCHYNDNNNNNNKNHNKNNNRNTNKSKREQQQQQQQRTIAMRIELINNKRITKRNKSNKRKKKNENQNQDTKMKNNNNKEQ